MRTIAASTLILGALLCTGTSSATDFSWTTLDYPGADSTFLYGIDNGKMVGWYRETGGEGAVIDSGFVYDQDTSQWSSLNYPFGSDTHLHAIQGDTVVGSYKDSADQRHGIAYDLQTNQWTSYGSVNGAPASDIFGLDGDKMVGYSVDSSMVKHGSYFDGSQWNTLNYPDQDAGVSNSFFHAINGQHIIGSYVDHGVSPAVEHGIVYDIDNQQWNTLDHPHASQTYLYEIEGAYLVGAFKDSHGYHGFHYDSVMDEWQTLDHPQGDQTALHGIDGNSLVGFYHDSSGGIHGFLVTGEFGQTQVVPEPAALFLAIVGLALLPRRRRR